ncbi:transcriptional regulator [Companilactobacillus mindensis DSM 14500]|jgi:Predicted transcriptional regulator|uniref:Transcriptional regulator n=1 Tax=Companilactobacillus mindensis DSM 14500 TaxID=1423770 RepID=A0A0R1QEW0_9LACO|nr:Rrf2 family transcriptional regulator [Companilactobacillus mindensis]KRL43360.1 transcriptional regulator [Companilactobacillus mindensis DSM 14500]GEO79692.1 Rrf2 family transcriptional regulator [Companilactobacillus mindensis]
MRVSTRFSDSVHILAFIEIYKSLKLSSELIASSIETSPVVVRRLMSTLRENDLIDTKKGSAEPKLSRSPREITLLDVYLAVEGDKQLFTLDTNTNPECIVGGNIQKVLGNYYEDAKMAALRKFNNVTLQDIIESIQVEQKAKEHHLI